MGWLSRLFGASAPAPAPRPAAPAVPAAAAPAASGDDTVAAPAPTLLGWLLQGESASPDHQTADDTARLAAALDEVLGSPRLPSDLLPRAAALVPQLIAMLRQGNLPVPALAERVAKDVAITTEVLRLASTPYYRTQGEVTDLRQAITVLGVEGLQTAITRVVLKPLYQAQPGTLSARLAPRLWEHADVLSRHVADAAATSGASRFDGYLAGLLHNTGWIVLLRVADRHAVPMAALGHPAVETALEGRAHRLFGLAAQGWDITPGFADFAADARVQPLASSTQPLARALAAAQPSCLQELAAASS